VSVNRLFVGGPLDGRIQPVHFDGEPVQHPLFRPVMYVAEGGALAIRDDLPAAIIYRPATAPTGERVYLADDTCWPDRFDTDAWPPRGVRLVRDVVPYERVETWHWRRLGEQGSWCWRGDVTDPDGEPRPRPWQPVIYVLGSPARPGDFIAYAQRIPFNIADPREIALDALAGRLTAEDLIVRELRYRIDWELLPRCPAPGCTEKASVRLRAKGPVRPLWERQDVPIMVYDERRRYLVPAPGTVADGEVLVLCPRHAADERRRLVDMRFGATWEIDLSD